jgi:hypothetical protein
MKTRIAAGLLFVGAINLGLLTWIYIVILVYAKGQVPAPAVFYAGTAVQAVGALVMAGAGIQLLTEPTASGVRLVMWLSGLAGVAAALTVVLLMTVGDYSPALLFYGPLALAGTGAALLCSAAGRDRR